MRISVPSPPPPPVVSATLRISRLSAWYGPFRALYDVTMPVAERKVTSIIGPAGCGKTTLLRCLNRTHETTSGARVTGEVLLDGKNVYGTTTNVHALRRSVGMVLRKPSPFPTMTVRENVLAGYRLAGEKPTRPDDVVERALREADLWDEVKDDLDDGPWTLSAGQQQRLCIARCLALDPEVLLLDEPCHALDPVATARLEDMVHDLRETRTVVFVTQSMQQAARVSDFTAFIYQGELVEHDTADVIFTKPQDPRTEDYVTGRFG